MVFLLLSSPSFLNSSSLPSLLSQSLHHLPPLSIVFCCSSMPRIREKLETVKTRLVREQRIRSEQRVRQLLQPRVTGQDIEVSDDSEEENRIRGIRPRGNRDQATQTNSSSYSFSFVVVLSSYIQWKWRQDVGKAKETRRLDAVLDDRVKHVGVPSKLQDKVRNLRQSLMLRLKRHS